MADDIDSIQKLVDEAHKLLDGAGVPEASGVACDDPECQTRLGHRLRTLIYERDTLRNLLDEARVNNYWKDQ